ncbi:unnamed protein product, partial [Choristocarpus tenellus]
NTTYQIGGLAITGKPEFLADMAPTFSEYLNNTVGKKFGVNFETVPLDFDDIEGAVTNGTIDFLYSNPSSYSCKNSQHGVAAVVSIRKIRSGNELNSFGGVIITAAGRDDIQNGKVVEAVSITGFGACQMQWGLLLEEGVGFLTDTTAVRFAYNQNKV